MMRRFIRSAAETLLRVSSLLIKADCACSFSCFSYASIISLGNWQPYFASLLKDAARKSSKEASGVFLSHWFILSAGGFFKNESRSVAYAVMGRFCRRCCSAASIELFMESMLLKGWLVLVDRWCVHTLSVVSRAGQLHVRTIKFYRVPFDESLYCIYHFSYK